MNTCRRKVSNIGNNEYEAIDHLQQRIFKEFKEYLILKIEISEGLIIYLNIF